MGSGCAGLQLHPPTVTLARLTAIEVGLLEQRFAFGLRVMNPNDTDIPISGVSFEVLLNGRLFARGVSDKPVNLRGLSETLLEVTAVSDLAGILGQIGQWCKGDRCSVTYVVRGRLVSGPFPGLNFESSGAIDLPASGHF